MLLWVAGTGCLLALGTQPSHKTLPQRRWQQLRQDRFSQDQQLAEPGQHRVGPDQALSVGQSGRQVGVGVGTLCSHLPAPERDGQGQGPEEYGFVRLHVARPDEGRIHQVIQQ